jgi:hypothetical protein
MSESGIDQNGKWTPAFPGQRPPAGPGNTLGETHGCYSPMRLQARADEFYVQLAPHVPIHTQADGPVLSLACFSLAQVERAGLVLAVEQARVVHAADEGEPPAPRFDRLAADARAWVKTASRLLDQLGMSPTSRARLGLDISATQRSLSIIDYYQAKELERLERGDDDDD